MDNTKLFTGRAENYSASRPDYSEEFIEYLYSTQEFNENSFIADIGSGTGKFAKHLLDKGSCVFCVEPNDDMRKTAETDLIGYEKFISLNGTSEETNIRNNSVDFVTAAQAFHWFNVEKFRSECKRILKPGGKVILVWNSRDIDNIVNKASYEIYKRYCPDFNGLSGGIIKDDKRIDNFFYSRYKRVEFENNLYYNKENFIRRSLSSSYSLMPVDKKYNEYIKEIENIFDKYSNDGIIEIGNNTVGYIGEI